MPQPSPLTPSVSPASLAASGRRVIEIEARALDALAARGELTDVKTLIGLQWLQKWRAGLWTLDWVATA